jgi:hypothetical protein
MLIAVEGLHLFAFSLQVFRCAPLEEPIVPDQTAR